MIDVAFIPSEEVRTAELAVVVDVLRASSTIAAALSAGYRSVLCCDGPERAEELRGDGRVLAGERDCRPIPGFDFGNSPGALDPGEGRELVLSTTNGCPAILAAAEAAEEVLIGSLINLGAVMEAIPADCDLVIVCAGTKGRFALEDAYAAGRIVGRLGGERTDAARAAERIAGAYPDPLQPLSESDDAAQLKATDQTDDIEFCAQESVVGTLPRVSDVSSGVATVTERAEGASPQADAHGASVGREAPASEDGRATDAEERNRLTLMRMARSFS